MISAVGCSQSCRWARRGEHASPRQEQEDEEDVERQAYGGDDKEEMENGEERLEGQSHNVYWAAHRKSPALDAG